MKGNHLYERLGVRVIKARKIKGFSQEKLSVRSKIDRTFIGKIERGIANPTFRTLLKICRALRISLSELFEGV